MTTGMPKPPKTETASPKQEDGALTENEVMFIIGDTLIPQHRDDPNVLRFISNYLSCRDATQAARDAGIADPARSGKVLRLRPDIHNCIEKLTVKSVMRFGFDASEVIEKFKEVAFFDPIELLNADGSYKKLQHMTPEARRAIKKFKAKNLFAKDPNGMDVLVGELIEVELHDKTRAGELLGREVDLFKEKKIHEFDVGKDMKNILLEAKNRGAERYEEGRDVTPLLEAAKDEKS
jgi:phage terminase small subunit